MIIVQCPQCQTKYRLDEKQFAGRPEIRLLCNKCKATYTAKAPAQTATAAAPTAATSPGERAAASRPAPGGAPGRPAPTGGPPMPEATVVSRKGGGLQLPADKRVALSVTQGPLKGQVFPLRKPRVVVGRAGTDIVVEDPEISRKHCALEVHGNSALLVDLGSTNGTFVEGQRIETHELEHLSEFRIGSTTLMFTVSKKE